MGPFSHSELIRLLDYEPSSGEFKWRSLNKGAGSVGGLGYLQIQIRRKKYGAHRLAWFYVYGEWPEAVIDHINGNKTDNRIENLRQANQRQNTGNSKLQSNNTSGFKGVSHHKRDKVWRTTVAGKHIGSFRCKYEAAKAYNVAALEEYGEFANLNII